MKKNYPLLFLATSLVIHSLAFAADVTVTGTTEVLIPITHEVPVETRSSSSSLPRFSQQLQEKWVSVQSIRLSSAAKKNLADQVTEITEDEDEEEAVTIDPSVGPLPTRGSAGMNGVPVLDQGRHGTCVTFATTAALDAALGHGDYISQLCNLELGSYLAKQNSNYTSGWDGSQQSIVFKQIKDYGIQTRKFQRDVGCAGVFEYPLDDENDIGQPMSVEDFMAHSEKVLDTFSWKPLITPNNTFSPSTDKDKILNETKKALYHQHRVVVSTLLDIKTGIGTFGNYKTPKDSWILADNIVQDIKDGSMKPAGHAMVITGYDDNAVIIGPNRTKHVGVFTLRNSWGPYAGNHGDYYMSYDYFRAMVMDLSEIVPIPLA